MTDSVTLKVYMFIHAGIALSFFFVFNILFYGIINIVGDDFLIYRFAISSQVIQLFAISYFLFIYRARVWPLHFRVSLREILFPMWAAANDVS